MAVTPSEKKQYEKQVELKTYRAMVNTSALGLLELSRDPKFKKLVNDEVAKKFTNESCVLLKTIREKSANSGINFDGAFKSSINKHNGNIKEVEKNAVTLRNNEDIGVFLDEINQYNAIHGFPHFGQNMFNQIYIPFSDRVNLNDDPIIVVGYQDAPTARGYEFASDGTVQSFIVDEQIAQNNLTWVISVNEVVDEYGNPPFAGGGEGPVVDLRSPTCIPTKFNRHAHMSGLKLNDRKEDWINGQSEVACYGVKYNKSCASPSWQNLGIYRVAQDDDNRENVLFRFGDDCLDKWINFDLRYGDNNASSADGLTNPKEANWALNAILFAFNGTGVNNNYNSGGTSVFDRTYVPTPMTEDEKIFWIVYEKDTYGSEWDWMEPWNPNCTRSLQLKYKSQQTPWAILRLGYTDLPYGIPIQTVQGKSTFNWAHQIYRSEVTNRIKLSNCEIRIASQIPCQP